MKYTTSSEVKAKLRSLVEAGEMRVLVHADGESPTPKAYYLYMLGCGYAYLQLLSENLSPLVA